MELKNLTQVDKNLIQKFLEGNPKAKYESTYMKLEGHSITSLAFPVHIAEYIPHSGKLPTIKVFNLEVFKDSFVENLCSLLIKELENSELYNTANYCGVSFYCPIACQDCEMSYKCAVMDDEYRINNAKPSLVATESDTLFF